MNNILGMKESCFFCEQNVLCTKEGAAANIFFFPQLEQMQ